MEWYQTLILIVGGLLVLIGLGLPVAFSFLLINIIGAYIFFGGSIGVEYLISSIYDSVVSFILLPLPLFILMGEVMFQSGSASLMIEAIDKWIGRVPGRLGLLATAGATAFATTSGSSVASVAVFGSVLVPEMERRGYKKPMSIGPILGNGGLAMMIPPSGMAILLAAVAEISVGKLLIAIVIPGILLAIVHIAYIITRCRLQPYLAPPYDVPLVPLREKIGAAVKHILPLGIIIFLVIGIVFLGVATPSEAAATGALGTFILAAAYRKLNWEVVKKINTNSIHIIGMMFMILVGAISFSQVLSFSGASRGLILFAMELPLSPIQFIIVMMIIVLMMGTFMEVFSIMMITLPIYMPIVMNLGFDPTWFGVLMLINLEMAIITPPFGLALFVMKGVAPANTTMRDIYYATLPFLCCDLFIMGLVMASPVIALWLPGMMH